MKNIILMIVLLAAPSLYAVNAYNVKDYGATGNGSTDDRAYIQNAIDAASAAAVSTGQPQDVFFPPGTYRSDWSILLKDNVSLYGSGMGASLKAGSTIQYLGLISSWKNDPNGSYRSDNVTIRFLELDGNRANYLNYGIVPVGSNITVQGCYLHDFAMACIEFGASTYNWNCSNLNILNNWAHGIGADTGRTGGQYWGALAVVCGRDLTILGNLITEGGWMQYAIDYGEPNIESESVDNITVQYNHSRGGDFLGTNRGGGVRNVRILDNDIDSANNYGGGASIVSNSIPSITVKGNTCRTHIHYPGCILIGGASSPTIEENFCTGIGTTQHYTVPNSGYDDSLNIGILLGSCTGGSVRNNTVAADAPTRSGYVAGIKRDGGSAPAYSGNHFYNITTPVTDSQTFLSDIYNVKTYGATGNGTTEDTNAIQSAINAANTAGGGTVYFPIGTYLCGSLTVKSNIAFRGAGRAAILKAKNSLNSYLIGIPDSSAAVDNVSIRLLTINGNKANNTSGSMIQFGGSNILISGMHIYDAADSAINIGNNNTVSNVNIRSNWIQNCGKSGNLGGGILIRMGTNVNVIGNVVSTADGYMQYIVKADAASAKSINSLTIKNNYSRGGCIIVQGAGTKSNITIEDNDLDAATAAGTPNGIYVTGATGTVSVQKNAVRCPSTTSPGIYIDSLSNPTVSYNYITGLGTQQGTYGNNVGILLSSVTGGTVSNNKIFAASPTQSGYVAGIKQISCSGQTITANKLYNITTQVEPTPTPTPTNTPTPTPTPFGPIHGTIVLGDYAPIDPSIPVSIRIELKQNDQIIHVEQQILGLGGEFTLQNVPPGDYTLGIKAATWLKKVISITKTGSALNIDPVELINGDLHGDNEIYFTSLSIVLARFGNMGDEFLKGIPQ